MPLMSCEPNFRETKRVEFFFFFGIIVCLFSRPFFFHAEMLGQNLLHVTVPLAFRTVESGEVRFVHLGLGAAVLGVAQRVAAVSATHPPHTHHGTAHAHHHAHHHPQHPHHALGLGA